MIEGSPGGTSYLNRHHDDLGSFEHRQFECTGPLVSLGGHFEGRKHDDFMILIILLLP